jgi:hypothetical protein
MVDDPTRSAWLDKLQPTAVNVVTSLWKPHHRSAMIWTSPRKRDRKGRITTGIEKNALRLRQFGDFRKLLLEALTRCDEDAARTLLHGSEFAHAIRLAFRREEAVTHFADFLVAGDNAWSHGDAGASVLWICLFRE